MHKNFCQFIIYRNGQRERKRVTNNSIMATKTFTIRILTYSVLPAAACTPKQKQK